MAATWHLPAGQSAGVAAVGQPAGAAAVRPRQPLRAGRVGRGRQPADHVAALHRQTG